MARVPGEKPSWANWLSGWAAGLCTEWQVFHVTDTLHPVSYETQRRSLPLLCKYSSP